MKRILFALLTLSILCSSCEKVLGDDNSLFGDDRGGGGGGGTKIAASAVPAPVKNAFNTQFPGAGNIEWKLLANGNYKVQFVSDNTKWEAIYNPAGQQLSLEKA
ncbi:MAG: hypothetical protein KGO82_12965 [Bacteroidota bacterium]|nr:hypothetical protein [Bacteroidota bacterium]